MADRIKDERLQWYWHHLTETAPNSGVFERISTNKTYLDRIGMEIHQMYLCPASAGWYQNIMQAVASGFSEYFWGATILNKQPSAARPDEEGVVAYQHKVFSYFWNAVTYEKRTFENFPWIIDFKEPVLTLPASTYPWVKGLGFLDASDVYIGFLYRNIELSDVQYREMIDYLLLKDTV